MTTRRRQFAAASAVIGGGLAAWPLIGQSKRTDPRKPQSRVAILTVPEYSDDLEGLLFETLMNFRPTVRGKSVVLKPNLVDHVPGSPVNTNPLLVGATADCFRRLGARHVVIAEGPGHIRDTELILSESGFERELWDRAVPFVDLNRDEVVRVRTKADYSGLGHLWLPVTIARADIVVSMPKIKTHHWAGITLGLKNMFGIVPGMRYGWPKNILHWHGIHASILDICATVPVDFVIADGIEAMEGNGPLHGELRRLNRLVVADDPVAADATCARLMGLNPGLVRHLSEAAQFLGNLAEDRISMIGEAIPRDVIPFRVPPEFPNLQIHQQ